MNNLSPRERLQPSLLDRLTNDAPSDLQESADKRVLSLNQLKASMLWDLTWLLNTASLWRAGAGLNGFFCRELNRGKTFVY